MRRRMVWTFLLVVAVVAYRPARAQDAPPGKATVPVFALRGPVTESPVDESFPLFDMPTASLRDLTTRMTKAAKDDNVKAVVLLADDVVLGSAQIEELRQAVAAIRAAGKDVLVHADGMRTGDYLLFAGASRISVSPTADLWLTGLYAEQPYLRGLLDKLGVTPEFLTCGEYKSAAEIFMRAGPSKQADEMLNWLLDSMYDTHLNLIAKGRGVTAEKAKGWIDNGPYTAERAKQAGIVDAVEHRQDFQARLREKYGKEIEFNRKYGQKQAPTVDLSNPFAAFKLLGDLFGGGAKKVKSDKPAVGIVFVEGPIMLGAPEANFFNPTGAGTAYSSAVRKALDKAAADDAVKGVVLRVDSPGGSAVASEIILDATRRVKAKKPFVVSMGNMAGSGGYYVACAADTIYADRATLTGSIGVVGGKLVTTPMWNKIGVTFKPYARGRRAALLNTDRPFTDEERAVVQGWMDEIYGVFQKHVTDVRGVRLKKPIDQLAGGRVYTGQQALDLGLVDRIGTLSDAIAEVAKLAKLEEGQYETRPVPEPKNFIEQLMEQSHPNPEDARQLDAGVRWMARPAAEVPSVLQLALPYLANLDPVRVRAIKQALLRLDLTQREGATLMMPEFSVP